MYTDCNKVRFPISAKGDSIAKRYTMTDKNSKLCFVIMPFGEKTDIAGKTVKFDDIYEHFIKDSIKEAGLSPVRCDELGEAGVIHRKMIEHIWATDVAVVDISLLNPNVFYELGVRHSLRKCVTILIRRKGTNLPFNIANLSVIEYDEADLASVAQAKKRIVEAIGKGLRSRGNDSLVHEILDLRISSGNKDLKRCVVYEYKRRQHPDKSICLITGDIQCVKGIDIWVNSENINMQMARFYDTSISSMIRYLGAKKSKTNKVTEDTIFNALADIMEGETSVEAGTVIPTTSGELEKTHGVKQLFHAAAVIGQIGTGYRPIDNLSSCVTNALKLVDSDFQDKGYQSILFPLFGAATGKGDLHQNTQSLFEAALAYLTDNPSSTINKVYFVTRSAEDLEMCQSLLRPFNELELLDSK